MYKKSAQILFLVVGTLAFQATAATAGWRAYGKTNPITSSSSTWKCGSTRTVGPNLLSQVCTVRTADGKYVQGAVIVRNNNNYLYGTNASMTVYYQSNAVRGMWECPQSGVGANSWSVCFGSTFAANSYRYYTEGFANNVYLGYTDYN